jgi:hypothetical protein
MTRDTRGTGRRHTGLIAGIWLIAIGLVFVVRDFGNLTWGEAWPLFIVAAGGASLFGSLARRRELSVGAWSLAWPIGWMIVGLVLFAATTDSVGVGPLEVITRWWPVGLVAIGIWFLVASVWPGRATPTESLAIPIAGVPSASVKINFGGGELVIGRAQPGGLVEGSFRGGVMVQSPAPGQIELKPDSSGGFPLSGRGYRWDVGLTGEIPLDLRLDTGASRASIDLIGLLVRRLDLHSGASETRVRLPAAAGLTAVRTETGVASLTIDVPPGVAARIRSSMALGRLRVDEARFPRAATGWESPDMLAAPNRVEIDVHGGVGSVTIR